MTAPSFDVLSWNVRISNRPKHVADILAGWLEHHDPEFVVLQEATRCRRKLAQVAANHGYVHYQGTRGQARGVATLIRADLEVTKAKHHPMRRWWRGPIHGLRQSPRDYPMFRVLITGRPLRFANWHFPVGDRKAVHESVRYATRWLHRGRTKVPALGVGDVNMGAWGLHRAVTVPAGRGAGVVAGHRADNAAVRGLTGWSETLTKGGSDHTAVLFHFTFAV